MLLVIDYHDIVRLVVSRSELDTHAAKHAKHAKHANLLEA